MKTAIKLVLIYLGIQILSALAVSPFCMLYAYFEYGNIEEATKLSVVPAMFTGFILMGWYLWKQGYLTGDKQMYSPVSVSYLGMSLVLGISTIFLIDFVMSQLTFLPDWMKETFDLVQSGWFGILCVAIIGPVLEELLFRGAITKVLLQRYSPMKAILFSGLIFGIFHLNPAQIVGATLSGFLFAWMYYKTSSVIPGILVHVLNNSISVYLDLHYHNIDTTAELLGEPIYLICLVSSVLLFIGLFMVMNRYKYSKETTAI